MGLEELEHARGGMERRAREDRRVHVLEGDEVALVADSQARQQLGDEPAAAERPATGAPGHVDGGVEVALAPLEPVGVPAGAVVAFDDEDVAPSPCERCGTGQPAHAAADHDDVVRLVLRLPPHAHG